MLELIANGLKDQFPPRLDVMHRNAEIYGVELNALKR